MERFDGREQAGALMRSAGVADGTKTSRGKRLWPLVAILAALLIVSNGWWLYQVVDVGVTLSYHDQMLEENREAAQQLVALVRATRTGAERQQVLEALAPLSDFEPFEKDGYLWIGRLGLQFDSNDRLARVVGPGQP